MHYGSASCAAIIPVLRRYSSAEPPKTKACQPRIICGANEPGKPDLSP